VDGPVGSAPAHSTGMHVRQGRAFVEAHGDLAFAGAVVGGDSLREKPLDGTLCTREIDRAICTREKWDTSPGARARQAWKTGSSFGEVPVAVAAQRSSRFAETRVCANPIGLSR
jgi:hypothetical protein